MAELNNSGTGQWSEVDNSNTSPVPDGWPGGMDPNQVEPCARSNMGALKRFWDRINSTVTTTGSAGAYIYTPTNVAFPTAYVQGETYATRANFTSVGGDTININGLGAKPLYKPGSSGPVAIGAGDIQTGQIFTMIYDANIAGGVLHVIAGIVSGGAFPSGTVIGAFMQAAAPTGWTQVTTWNDAVLRFVNDGSGGGTGGSWNITGNFGSTGGTAISQAQLPNYNLTVNDPTHSHNGVNAVKFSAIGGSGGSVATSGTVSDGSLNTPDAATGISVNSAGSGQAHTHTLGSISSDGVWRPAYVNALVASKN